jgi:hypothetical protein
VLFVYKNAEGIDDEGTLVARDATSATVTLDELSEIFPGRDPAAKTMTIRVRVYGSSALEGTIWAGPKREFPVPADLPISKPETK